MGSYIVNVPTLRLGEKRVFAMGESVDLSSELASKLMKKAYIKFDKGAQKMIVPEGAKVTKLIPEGNVDKVKAYISSTEDIDLLQKMAEEEESDKNRKTVLEAIYERAQELAEDNEDSDDNGTPNINLNPEDVIVNA